MTSRRSMSHSAATLGLVTVLAAALGGCQSHEEALEIICDAPKECSACGDPDPQARILALTRHLKDRVKERGARHLLLRLSEVRRDEERVAEVEVVLKEASIEACPLLYWLQTSPTPVGVVRLPYAESDDPVEVERHPPPATYERPPSYHAQYAFESGPLELGERGRDVTLELKAWTAAPPPDDDGEPWLIAYNLFVTHNPHHAHVEYSPYQASGKSVRMRVTVRWLGKSFSLVELELELEMDSRGRVRRVTPG